MNSRKQIVAKIMAMDRLLKYEKSEVTMEFLLENGEKLSVKIDGQILKDLISLSEYFPENKNTQGK